MLSRDASGLSLASEVGLRMKSSTRLAQGTVPSHLWRCTISSLFSPEEGFGLSTLEFGAVESPVGGSSKPKRGGDAVPCEGITLPPDTRLGRVR